LFWLLYNAFAIFVSIFIALEKTRYRATERTNVELSADFLIENCKYKENCGKCGFLSDISERGTQFTLKKECEHFKFKEGNILKSNIENIGVIESTIKRITNKDGIVKIGVEFKNLKEKEYGMINELRFSTKNKYVDNMEIEEGKNTISILKKVVKLMKK
jgi:cellulose synthase (UDP-forming)